MLKEYRVWIVAPQEKGGLFRLSIHPSSTVTPNIKHVAQTLVTRRELKDLLIRSLPAGQNSLSATDAIIKGAEERVFNFKSGSSFLLSDEQARGLGWSFSAEQHSLSD